MIASTALDIGPLAPFHQAGVLDLADVHVAVALMRIGGQPIDGRVALAAALCVRALRQGSVCVDVNADPAMWTVTDDTEDDALMPPAPVPHTGSPDSAPDLPWPPAQDWAASLRAHPLVSQGGEGTPDRPLRLVGNLLYLQRYWLDEHLIRTRMRQRARTIPVDVAALTAALTRLFPGAEPDRQRLAAAMAALRGVTIVAGGPGTGKTTTVARLLAVLRALGDPQPSIALAAPTGKAAARLQQAVADALGVMGSPDRERVGPMEATTLHRLLGWRPDSQGRFRHDRANPLPHDVVVVDETSMVSLPLMARLLEAVRPDARLVLVGDPDQLASVEAGAVLGDLVAAPSPETEPADQVSLAAALALACPADASDGNGSGGVVVLDRNYRFSGPIAALSTAIRAGDADGAMALLHSGHAEVDYRDVAARPDAPQIALEIVRADVVAQARDVVDAAAAGDAAAALASLESHRVLCAHRRGPFGVTHWSALMESWTARTAGTADRPDHDDPWYVGRPLLVTANDYAAKVYNGDTGVVIAVPGGQLRAAFSRGGSVVLLPPSRLDAVETLRAMTIHRGQGSQFGAVAVILPPPESPLLTRELLYTAITRARTRIRIVGTEAAVRGAIGRQVRRASGLREPAPVSVPLGVAT